MQHYNWLNLLRILDATGRIAITLFVILCGFAVSNAQTGSTPGVADTRARRADTANAVENTSNSGTTTMEGVTTNPARSQQAPATSNDAQTSANGQPKTDRVSVLRSQIQDAKSEVERVRLQRTLVDYLIALGRPTEAAVELRAMLSAENLDPASYYNIGNGLARLGDSEQAILAYRKAIDARQGNYPRALNNLGVVLFELGRIDEAYDAFVLAIKQQNFRYAEASYNLGKLYATRNEAELAISEWTRALTVQPDHVDTAIALARAYAVTGKASRGIEVIDTTLKRTGANQRLEVVRAEIATKVSAK